MHEDNPQTSSLGSALRKRNIHLEYLGSDLLLTFPSADGRQNLILCLSGALSTACSWTACRQRKLCSGQSWESRQLQWKISWQCMEVRSCIAVVLFSVCRTAYLTSSALRFSSADGTRSEELDLMILAGVCSKCCANDLPFPTVGSCSRCYELGSYSS